MKSSVLPLLLPLVLSSIARADTNYPGPLVTFQKSGCVVQARAYIDSHYSRFDLYVEAAKGKPARWEFTLPEQEYDPGNNITGQFALHPYGNQKRTTINVILHRFDVYDERVTFKNLDLAPVPPDPKAAWFSLMRHLELKKALTRTTPSGISVTLPAQSTDALPMNFNGNAEAVFIKIHVSPHTVLSHLPRSPLFQKYGKQARIQLEVAPPNGGGYSLADNTYQLLAVYIPHLKTATKMDLTLIVRQKVELETVPVALNVPVARPIRS